jgi:preprotein translocase subunit SecE
MSIISKIKDYFQGAFSEMKKVVWPTKKQTIRYSGIVIGLSLAMAIFFGLLDYAFNLGLEKIITK